MSQDPAIGDLVRRLLKNHERGVICFGEVFNQIVFEASRVCQVVAELPDDVVDKIKEYLERQPKSDQEWKQQDDDWIEYDRRFYMGTLYKGDKNDEAYQSSCQMRADERRQQTAAFRSNIEILKAYFTSLD
jgi:hypothetical protein